MIRNSDIDRLRGLFAKRLIATMVKRYNISLERKEPSSGLKRPHFRFSSLISIFECHVCAKGGSGPLTGPCSVGKEAARGVQNQGQGYRGVAS